VDCAYSIPNWMDRACRASSLDAMGLAFINFVAHTRARACKRLRSIALGIGLTSESCLTWLRDRLGDHF
jgi:hypothetical protein